MTATPPARELRQLALTALLAQDPQEKVALALYLRAQSATIFIARGSSLATRASPPGLPGCPARPELRSHLDVPKRSPFTAEGLAALLHAVTHIEFNAIKIAFPMVIGYSLNQSIRN
jgi:uncharacterized ferritin-like protein (DUF455 family)